MAGRSFPDFRVLRFFLTVAEHGSVASAAKSLFIAQPALSRQMMSLENELGSQLFVRKPRGVVLTRAGEELRLRAAELMVEAERIKSHIALADQGRVGVLRLGLVPGYTWLPMLGKAIRRMAEAAPNVGILIDGSASLQQLEAVKRGHLDVAIAAWRSPLDPALTALPVYRDRIAVAMPAELPMARKRSLLLRDLAGQPFILFPRDRSPAHYDTVARLLKAADIPKPAMGALTAPDSPTILGLVANGLGCALVPASYASQVSSQVVIRTADDLDMTFDLELVWRVGDHHPLVEKFVEVWFELSASS